VLRVLARHLDHRRLRIDTSHRKSGGYKLSQQTLPQPTVQQRWRRRSIHHRAITAGAMRSSVRHGLREKSRRVNPRESSPGSKPALPSCNIPRRSATFRICGHRVPGKSHRQQRAPATVPHQIRVPAASDPTQRRYKPVVTSIWRSPFIHSRLGRLESTLDCHNRGGGDRHGCADNCAKMHSPPIGFRAASARTTPRVQMNSALPARRERLAGLRETASSSRSA